jgi:hypothetical protein
MLVFDFIEKQEDKPISSKANLANLDICNGQVPGETSRRH